MAEFTTPFIERGKHVHEHVYREIALAIGRRVDVIRALRYSAYSGSIPDRKMVDGAAATTDSDGKILIDVAAFAGLSLDDRICFIVESTGGNVGAFKIHSHTDDVLKFVIESDSGITYAAGKRLRDSSLFAGHNLAGKTCVITSSTGGNTGNFTIVRNDPSYLYFLEDPGNGTAVEYSIVLGDPGDGTDVTYWISLLFSPAPARAFQRFRPRAVQNSEMDYFYPQLVVDPDRISEGYQGIGYSTLMNIEKACAIGMGMPYGEDAEIVTGAQDYLIDTGAFAGRNLVGMDVMIGRRSMTQGWAGKNFTILSHTDDALELEGYSDGDDTGVPYFIYTWAYDGDTEPDNLLPYMNAHCHMQRYKWQMIKGVIDVWDNCWGMAHPDYRPYTYWYSHVNLHLIHVRENLQYAPDNVHFESWPSCRADVYSRLASSEQSVSLLGYSGHGDKNGDYTAWLYFNDELSNNEGEEFDYDLSGMVDPPDVVAVGMFFISNHISGSPPRYYEPFFTINVYLDDTLMNSSPIEIDPSQERCFWILDNWESSGFELDGTSRTITLKYVSPTGDPGSVWEEPGQPGEGSHNTFLSGMDAWRVAFLFKFDFDNI